jgi:tRNA(Ile)-lysidine synthetase-like protein
MLVDSADVRALARREHRSIEDAARTARHAFFERARIEAGADVVAVGHTRDDQAETFLLRLLRGAGSQGLGSMYPRNGSIIRPLLECRRDELTAYLQNKGATFVHDASNGDVGIPRNRIRAELVPFLTERFNPSVVDVLADAADVAREEWTWLNEAAELVERQIVLNPVTARPVTRPDRATPPHLSADFSGSGNQIGGQSRNEDRTNHHLELDGAALAAAPIAVARIALRHLMTRAAGGRFVGFAAVEQALELSRGHGTDFDAPGQRVQRIGSRIVLTGRPLDAIGRVTVSNSVEAFNYALSIPGEVELKEIGSVISAEEAAGMRTAVSRAALSENGTSGSDESRGDETRDSAQMRAPALSLTDPDTDSVAPEPIRPRTVIVRRDLCGTSLSVRNRRPGDTFRPAGLGGRKKLQDFFVDRKIERQQRDAVPLVVDEIDRIVWVAGHAVNEDFRVTDPAQAVIILRLKGVGGAV